MTRIAYFVHGNGRGHATRTVSIVRRLRTAGHEVSVFGGGAVATVLAPGSYELIPVTRLVHPKTLLLPIRALRLAWRLRGVQVVFSDGDLLGLLVGRLLRVPVVSVGHGLTFNLALLPAGLPARSLRAERRKNALHVRWSQAQIAVHFLEAQSAAQGAIIARPDPPPVLENSADEFVWPEGEFVVAYFNRFDGVEHVRCLQVAGLSVLVFTRTPGVYPEGTFTAAPDELLFRQALRRATAAIGSAGSNLITECLDARLPLLALYPANVPEQRLNVELGRSAGVLVGAAATAPADVGTTELLRLMRTGSSESGMARLPLASEAAVSTLDALGLG